VFASEESVVDGITGVAELPMECIKQDRLMTCSLLVDLDFVLSAPFPLKVRCKW
jgi:hypothetical protein